MKWRLIYWEQFPYWNALLLLQRAKLCAEAERENREAREIGETERQKWKSYMCSYYVGIAQENGGEIRSLSWWVQLDMQQVDDDDFLRAMSFWGQLKQEFSKCNRHD